MTSANFSRRLSTFGSTTGAPLPLHITPAARVPECRFLPGELQPVAQSVTSGSRNCDASLWVLANRLYKLSMILLFELYARRYPIVLRAEWYAEARPSEGSAVRLGMTATLVFEVMCVAGVLFMIRFLVALFRESRRKSSCRIVYLSSRRTQTRNDAFSLIPTAGSGRSANLRRSRFEVIAGGTKPPARRVG
jgi:hypothetical protein